MSASGFVFYVLCFMYSVLCTLFDDLLQGGPAMPGCSGSASSACRPEPPRLFQFVTGGSTSSGIGQMYFSPSIISSNSFFARATSSGFVKSFKEASARTSAA